MLSLLLEVVEKRLADLLRTPFRNLRSCRRHPEFVRTLYTVSLWCKPVWPKCGGMAAVSHSAKREASPNNSPSNLHQNFTTLQIRLPQRSELWLIAALGKYVTHIRHGAR